MDHGDDLSKNRAEGTTDDADNFTPLRRDSISLRQTTEKAVARIGRQGTQGTGTVTIGLEGGNQIRQQPGARMQESRKRNSLITQGLESDHAGNRNRVKTGGRNLRRREYVGKTPGQNRIKDTERIIRAYHG